MITLRSAFVCLSWGLFGCCLGGCGGNEIGYDSLGRRIVEEERYEEIQSGAAEEPESGDFMFFDHSSEIAIVPEARAPTRTAPTTAR